jgi:hypothetical protein
MAEEGLTPVAIRDAAQELKFKIKNESEASAFHIWDLGHEDLPAGVIVEVESLWIGHTGPPQGYSEDQFLKDLNLRLRTLLERRPSPNTRQWICFAAPVPREPGDVVYPVWQGPIDAQGV